DAAREAQWGAVGARDLDVPAAGGELDLVAEFPAPADEAVAAVGAPAVAAVYAVVVAHDLQPEHAGQGGQVDFALVLVAGDDVDGVATALAAGVAADVLFLAAHLRRVAAGRGGVRDTHHGQQGRQREGAQQRL